MFNEIEKLYYKKIYVTLKVDDINERRSPITITVELHILTSPFPRKALKIRLTDESDLFFYYSLVITEEDFQCLKTQQGLLVDFLSFPQRFIDLLQLCNEEDCKENPKFILIFSRPTHQNPSSSAAHLDVVETNLFKHLVHLSLKFVQGSDSEVKKYLAESLKDCKNRNELLEKELSETEKDLTARLRQTQEYLNTKTRELDRLNVEVNEKITSTSSQLMHEISIERGKSEHRINDLQIRHDREKKDLQFNYDKTCRHLELKISDLEQKNGSLTEKKCELDASMRDLQSKLIKSEDEVKYLKQELQNVQYNNTSLGKSVEEKEKLMKSIKSRTATLEEEVKAKQEANIELSGEVDLLKQQNRKLEEKCEERERGMSNLDVAVKELRQDVSKANEIIKKLHSDVKSNQEKVKLRSQIASEQENVLKEKDLFIKKLHSELTAAKEVITVHENELKETMEKLKDVTEKMEKYQKDLKTNENVIAWLNKQLSEKAMLQAKGAEIAKQHLFQRHQPPGIDNFITPINQPLGFHGSTAIPKPQTYGYFQKMTQYGENVNSGKINKENDPPLDMKYLIQSKPVNKGDCSKEMLNEDGSCRNELKTMQIKKPLSSTSNRIPKSNFLKPASRNAASSRQALIPPSSAYFTKPTTGTV